MRVQPKNNRKRKPHAEWLNVEVTWRTGPESKDITAAIPSEWKNIDDENMLVGYASVFGGPPDSAGDIITPGAFRKTIRERVKTGMVKLLDSHMYDSAHTLGTVIEAVEDPHGLLIQARLSTAPSVLDIKKKMTDGILDKLSIGFDSVKERYGQDPDTGRTVRYLDEIKLYEISVVPIPALDRAQILSVKAVVPFQDFPLMPKDAEWDPKQAEQNVKQAFGGEALDLAKYRRAFLWYDAENPEDVSGYRYQIADYEDGRLVASPKALQMAAADVYAKEGDEMDAMREQLGFYFAKMREEFDDDTIRPPWDVDAFTEDALAVMEEESLLDLARRLVMAMEERGIKAEPMGELKAGRRHSSADAKKITAAIDALLDLLNDDEQRTILSARMPKEKGATVPEAVRAEEPPHTSHEARLRRLKLKEFELKGGTSDVG